jgi:hypothetical protein
MHKMTLRCTQIKPELQISCAAQQKDIFAQLIGTTRFFWTGRASDMPKCAAQQKVAPPLKTLIQLPIRREGKRT